MDDGDDPAGLAFRARALAQAHPLSAAAQRSVNRAVRDEAVAQPRAELGAWAGTALTQGYCLRCVQEGERLATPSDAMDDEALDRAALAHAAALRSSSGDEVTVAALDLLVGSQVEHRLDQWRDELDDATWTQLAEYLTWWVVKGYGLRLAETSAQVP